MRFLRWQDEQGRQAAVIFGLGVVGQAIERALRRMTAAHSRRLPFDWGDAAQRAEALEKLEAEIGGDRLAVIWAAGRSGFGSGPEELRAETALLDEVLAFAARQRRARPAVETSFHLVSSAGGLFEGIAPCGPETAPRPLRPYGEGKLVQECRLAEAGVGSACIYRLSSVYGYAPGGRVGLITALIRNALQARRTHIFGGLNTIRDYVLADDVGRFIARQAAGPLHPGTETFLLASARPVVMFEMIALVERTVSVPLLLQFDPHPSNARDISFLPSALPRNWSPSPLVTGVVQVARQIRHGFA